MGFSARQKGQGVLGWIFMLFLLGFVGLFIMKLVPAYIEYFNVRTVMDSFKGGSEQYATAMNVREAVRKRFGVNDVKSINADDVVIEPTSGGYDLRADYEVRVPFVSNVSLVVKFTGTGRAFGGSDTP